MKFTGLRGKVPINPQRTLDIARALLLYSETCPHSDDFGIITFCRQIHSTLTSTIVQPCLIHPLAQGIVLGPTLCGEQGFEEEKGAVLNIRYLGQ